MAPGTNPLDRAEALARLEPGLVDQLLAALGVNPNAVHFTLHSLASDPITMEPVNDYITDVDERCFLFRQLDQILVENYPTYQLNATILGFVMVAPIAEIKEAIKVTESAPAPMFSLYGTNGVAPVAVRCCMYP